LFMAGYPALWLGLERTGKHAERPDD